SCRPCARPCRRRSTSTRWVRSSSATRSGRRRCAEDPMARAPRFDIELGAFVEEISADLARFECAAAIGCGPGDVWIEREVPLGDGYADILVEPPRGGAFFVENKLEYAPADVVARIRGEHGLEPSRILEPRTYEDVVVLMADLCSFSGYVRDTPDRSQIRRRLTEFYSLARHAVLNAGGMLYQFVGDEIVALFGMHEEQAP